MNEGQLLAPTTVYRLGRARARHAFRVGIEDGKVTVGTRCGIPFDGTQVAELGFVTCEECGAAP